MLQQTQVETVIPYFNRFIERFPDFRSLARASEEEVFALWSGLGYYRRARNLHHCAKTVMTEHKGRFPSDKRAVLDLPGIGPYTAGALLSIAFDQPEPLVDGNVERVLSRLCGIDDDLATNVGKKAIWDIAYQIVPNRSPGCFNQALMDLGATVCKPRNPTCDQCPIAGICFANKTGTVASFPVKSKKNKTLKVKEVLLLVRWRDKWLLTNRNEESIYSGLWQFPWMWIGSDETDLSARIEDLRKYLKLHGRPSPILATKTEHSVTHRRIETSCFFLDLGGVPEHSIQENEHIRLSPLIDLKSAPLPSYQKKLIPMLARL